MSRPYPAAVKRPRSNDVNDLVLARALGRALGVGLHRGLGRGRRREAACRRQVPPPVGDGQRLVGGAGWRLQVVQPDRLHQRRLADRAAPPQRK